MYYSVTIQNFTVAKNDDGEPIKTWATFATVKAAVNTTSTGEREENDRQTDASVLEFGIRTLANLTPKMRILYNSLYYEITGIIPVGRRYQIIKTMLSLKSTY